MLLKILFWLFAAIDIAAVGLWFVLGLAAAGPSKTNPLTVVLLLLVVPGLLLGGAILLFVRAQTPGLRLGALAIVAAPFALIAVSHVLSLGWLITHPGQAWGSTRLTDALTELERDPGQIAVLRQLLAEGADPNEAGDMLPLALAIYATRHAGMEPMRLLLDAGADPNARDQFGNPAFFAATGAAIDVAVLQELLARGADVTILDGSGDSAVWDALNTTNWPVALLLLQRGASTGGTSPMGLSLLGSVEQLVRTHGDHGPLGEILQLVRTRQGK